MDTSRGVILLLSSPDAPLSLLDLRSREVEGDGHTGTRPVKVGDSELKE